LFSYGKMMVGGADSSAKLLLNVVFKADIPPTTLEYTFAEPNMAARWGFFSPPEQFASAPLILAVDIPAVCGWIFGYNSIEQDVGVPMASPQFAAGGEGPCDASTPFPMAPLQFAAGGEAPCDAPTPFPISLLALRALHLLLSLSRLCCSTGKSLLHICIFRLIWQNCTTYHIVSIIVQLHV
jgi:hypothetical protein